MNFYDRIKETGNNDSHLGLLALGELEQEVLDKGTQLDKVYYYFKKGSEEESLGLLDGAFSSIRSGELYLGEIKNDSLFQWLQLIRLQTLSNIYVTLGQYEKALDHANEVLIICEGKYSFPYEGILINIAGILLEMGNANESFNVLSKALNHYRLLNDTSALIDVYHTLSVFQLRLGNLRLAESYADSTYFMALNFDDLIVLGYESQLKGDIAFHLENWDEVISYYKQAESIFDSTGLVRSQAEVTKFMSYAYEEIDDIDKALIYSRMAKTLGDSASSLEYTENVSKQQVAFETREKDNQIKITNLKLDNEKQEKEAAIASRNVLIGGVLAILLISGILLRSFRQKQILAKQQVEIGNQKVDDLIVRQEIKLLDALSDGQERERKRLARDLHDRMGSLLVSLKMNFDSLKKTAIGTMGEKIEQTSELIHEAIEEVRRISHNLSSQNIAEFGLVPALKGLKATIEQANTVKIEVYGKGLQKRLPSNLEVEIYRIIQEIISNALKHAQAKTISINMTRDDDEFSLIVEDDGKGFDANVNFSGIGLKNMKSRAEDLNAELYLDSAPGRGTTIILNLNLKENPKLGEAS